MEAPEAVRWREEDATGRSPAGGGGGGEQQGGGGGQGGQGGGGCGAVACQQVSLPRPTAGGSLIRKRVGAPRY